MACRLHFHFRAVQLVGDGVLPAGGAPPGQRRRLRLERGRRRAGLRRRHGRRPVRHLRQRRRLLPQLLRPPARRRRRALRRLERNDHAPFALLRAVGCGTVSKMGFVLCFFSLTQLH